MTKEQILKKLAKDLEARGKRDTTVEEYVKKIELFQNHYDKPADQMGETEIMDFQHYLLKRQKSNSFYRQHVQQRN